MFELNQLEQLVAIAKCGTLSGAAVGTGTHAFGEVSGYGDLL